MTTAAINQLFEEGITHSRELSDAADGAMRAIDDMAKEAEELAQRVARTHPRRSPQAEAALREREARQLPRVDREPGARAGARDAAHALVGHDRRLLTTRSVRRHPRMRRSGGYVFGGYLTPLARPPLDGAGGPEDATVAFTFRSHSTSGGRA